MSAIYDNWERLVAAAVKKQQLWELFHAPSRSPSILSEASDFSSSSRYGDQDSWWQEEPAKLVLLSDFSPPFNFKNASMASAELLGNGTFGSAYSVIMDDGVKIVVTRLKSGSMSELEFKHHMHTVGNIRHGNIAPLRAYYASGNERILLYDYYADGSVYALLHGQTGETLSPVSWETRLEIAIGAARAIAKIHKINGGKLVHGNIKSSNLLLTPQANCCVSDLGLANTIETTFMPTTRCYAPEVKTSKDVSQASDVYSFGILLLELLTRKPSVHIPGGPEAVDLVKLVTSRSTSKVFDADLLQNQNIKNDMIYMLQIGMKCVAKSTKKRPKMSEVANMIEDIFHAPGRKEFVFLKNVIPRFNLEDALTASAEVLEIGTLRSSYIAMLDNGNTIVVKRLKVVTVTYKAFQEHMEVYGKMNHKNLADIIAYYYSRDERLVVCQYYHDSSVSLLLHGIEGSRRSDLDWKSRLKIATDAAMGIAHIHGQEDGKLVHGNIKSSNIFFLEQNYAVVADAGYTKLTSPVKLSDKQHPGYHHHAPEVTDTGKVSQASDVYSFGVFMIELASGLPLQHTTVLNDKVTPIVEWFQSIARDEWMAEVFDLQLLRHQKMEEEVGMIQFVQIATDCVNSEPQRRPKMPQVVKMLEMINGVGVSGESGVEDLEEALGASMESRLEEILENLLLPALKVPTQF